jgi:hypothetical protein
MMPILTIGFQDAGDPYTQSLGDSGLYKIGVSAIQSTTKLGSHLLLCGVM